tara:strand:- start:1568 stop:1876 length:309 start_codon:yes stop_codon:yes gene_type:complete
MLRIEALLTVVFPVLQEGVLYKKEADVVLSETITAINEFLTLEGDDEIFPEEAIEMLAKELIISFCQWMKEDLKTREGPQFVTLDLFSLGGYGASSNDEIVH